MISYGVLFIICLIEFVFDALVFFLIGYNIGYAEALDVVKHDHSLIDGLRHDPDLLNKLLK